jgi:hypothetical protein
MNPKRNTTVTRGPWNYGGCLDHRSGIYTLQPFRVRHRDPALDRLGSSAFGSITQRGQLYGHQITADYDARNAESTRLGLLYGYIQRYGRNTCRFVQSRAARRRGHRTDDRMYNRAAEYHAKRRHDEAMALVAAEQLAAMDRDAIDEATRD